MFKVVRSSLASSYSLKVRLCTDQIMCYQLQSDLLDIYVCSLQIYTGPILNKLPKKDYYFSVNFPEC